MSSKVEVLCPNGHRVNVKTTPNTTILQILEEACLKKGFQPSEEFDLKHGKKVLDVTLTVRFAGLPNLAKLELVKASKPRQPSAVLIALQIPNGQRLQKEFPPATTLMEILKYWEEQPDSPHAGKLYKCDGNNHPVCIYMRDEVIGTYALSETTLKSLGLTSGKAILRLAHRAVESDVLDQIRESIDKEKSRVAKLKAKCSEQTISSPSAVSQSTEVMDTSTENAYKEEKMDCSNAQSFPQASKANTTTRESVQERKDSSTDGKGAKAKVPVIQTVQSDQQMDLTSNQEQIARQLAQQIMPGIFPNRDDAYEARQAELERRRMERIAMEEVKNRQLALQQAQPDFSNFKFPESTKGKELYKNELSEYDPTDFKPCDRETVVFNAADPRNGKNEMGDTNDDLPDNFFEITENDVRVMYADLQKQLDSEANAPLMTKSLKLAQAEARIMSKYDRVIIRFHCPDKIVIQGLFRPKETVFAMEKYVREMLYNKNLPFYLYTSPPKHILKDNSKTLIAANLAPMSVVYVGLNEPVDDLLSPAVLQECSSQLIADHIVSNHCTGGKSGSSQGASTSQGAGPSTLQSTKRVASTGAKKDPGKVPKWFKMGGK